jgi:hypothetical protein
MPGCGYVASAQTPVLTEAARTVVGAWELSNAERDRRCTVTLKAGAAGAGFELEWDQQCNELFPFTREAVSWRIGAREALQFLNAQGQPALEMSEVEGGLYEGERPGQGLLFLQKGERGEERKAEGLFGDWTIIRGSGRPLCQLTLSGAAAVQDAFALALKPGCDASIVRFAPIAWRLERGELVLVPARGESWRFEEIDAATWRRIPPGRQPLQLVRQ